MTLRPNCTTCYDTGFWQDDPIPADPKKFEGNRMIYPSMLCICPVAQKWLAEGRHSSFKLGGWDGYCHSTHPTHFTWNVREGYWAALDFGIIDDTIMLWNHGIDTEFSCEGRDGHNTRYFKLARKEDIPSAVSLLRWVNHVRDDGPHRAVYEHGYIPDHEG